ncbi:MAG: hypothetical protein V4736_14580 [Bdellovibrionota bacterium]
MKALFTVIAIALISSLSFAKIQKVKILSADDWKDSAVIEIGSHDEKWVLDVAISCRLEQFVGVEVEGHWGIDPDSAGAELNLPNGEDCKIWDAKKL